VDIRRLSSRYILDCTYYTMSLEDKALAVMADRNAVIVSISGCSSSGKTTLARLLRDLFPNTFILHEDDFYKPESE
jgi:pantothenate kinase-related protein Tda10